MKVPWLALRWAIVSAVFGWGLWVLRRYLGPNIQRPTLPTLVMGPILIVMYARLARREDEELGGAFGKTYADYAARTPMFLPWGNGRGFTLEAHR